MWSLLLSKISSRASPSHLTASERQLFHLVFLRLQMCTETLIGVIGIHSENLLRRRSEESWK